MREPLYIAICEDTKQDQELLLKTISNSAIVSDCTVFDSGEALLKQYEPQKYDLILSDIFMDGLDGVETITKIREVDDSTPVAFITTSTDYTLESYRLSALKYIEKPFKQKDIDDILKLADLERLSAPSLILQKNRADFRIHFSRVIYLEQQKHLLTVYLQDGTNETFREKLSNLIPQFEGLDFFQPHKSYLVNLAYVRSIDASLRCLKLQHDYNIPIRRESMSQAKQVLRDYLFRKTRGDKDV